MSCRTSRYGSAFTSLALQTSGLSEPQVLSSYHELRATGTAYSIPAPTPEEWESYLGDIIAVVEDSDNMSEARRTSILARLEQSRDELPDGGSWYALQRIRGRTDFYASHIDEHIFQHALTLGTTFDEAQETFASYIEQVGRGRSLQPPAGYEDIDEARSLIAPPHMQTRVALARLGEDIEIARGLRPVTDLNRVYGGRVYEEPETVTDSAGNTAPARRIVLETLEAEHHPFIAAVGYDREDGRLEVRLRDPEGETGAVEAYHSVPEDVWDQMRNETTSSMYGVFVRDVQGNDEYRYITQDAADAAAGPLRCTDCGQFTSGGHSCPVAVPEGMSTAAVSMLRSLLDPTVVDEDEMPVAYEGVVEEVAEDARTVDEDRPEAVFALDLGLENRNIPRERGLRPGEHPHFSDQLRGPGLTATRQAARDQPVLFSTTYRGSRWSANHEPLPYGGFMVTQVAELYRRPDGEWDTRFDNVECSCRIFRENRTCPHVRFSQQRILDRYIPVAERPIIPLSPAEIAEAQRRAEEALSHDWTRQEVYQQALRARWEDGAGEAVSYSDDYAAFEEACAEGARRRRAREPFTDYRTENVLGGAFTRESGEGFGVEIEFDFSNQANRSALSRIAAELNEAGLTSSSEVGRYHASRNRGYTDQHEGGWSIEEDATVAAEIVSPIMYDEPKTWENLAKVCEIVKRHGGVPSVRTGAHVHVSSPHTTVQTGSELIRMVNQHEDVLYRMSARPGNQHRHLSWCGPQEPVPSGGYQDVYDMQDYTASHSLSVNMQSVAGRSSDHVEFRMWDGSLDPVVMPHQIKMSCAMMGAAVRNGSQDLAEVPREPYGSHFRRGENPGAEISAEEDTATARNLIDTIFSREEDKVDAARLFGVTQWMKPGF